MSKIEDQLRMMFPDRDPRDAMHFLLREKKLSYSKVGRVLRVSSERAWRYAQQQGLLTPRSSSPEDRFNPLLKELQLYPGRTPRERLQNLRTRWGSWKAVSLVLGFNKNYVEAYRKVVGLVLSQNRIQKGSWRKKYEATHGKGSVPRLPRDGGRETEQD